MERDDLLCSRNARPQKALVGRAQWKINQPPSLEIASELGKKRGAARCPSCSRNAHDQNVLVRRAHSRIDQATLENEVEDWNNVRSGRPI